MLTIEIDKDAIYHNAAILSKEAGRLCAVVKANAYGHGLVEVAKKVSDLSAFFAVGFACEALELRANGIKKPIIILGALEYDILDELSNQDITVTAHCFEDVLALQAIKKPISVHIKVDCGMHRLGFSVDELNTALQMLKRNKCVNVCGIYTHFSEALPQNEMRAKQHQQFLQVVDGFNQQLVHCGASAVALNDKSLSHDMARCGIALYGYYPYNNAQKTLPLKRALSAFSSLTQIKRFSEGDRIGYEPSFVCKGDTLVGVVACGYGDGIRRSLSNCGKVAIEGRLYRIIGNICMDMFMVDLEGNQAIKNGSRVDLICDCYDAWDMASDAGTIAYEILTGFSERANRIFL